MIRPTLPVELRPCAVTETSRRTGPGVVIESWGLRGMKCSSEKEYNIKMA